MRISVIIPTYYKNSYKDVLASIYKQDFKDFEVIVVKNGGEKESYYSKKNLKAYEITKTGLDNARNFGIKKAAGEIVAFTDDDAIVAENWLSTIAKSHELIEAPVIGGKVLPKWPNNKKPKWVKGILLAYLSILENYSNASSPTPVHPLDWLAGTNISFKKYIFDKVGYFDDDLDRKGTQLLSSGEVELCNRIRNKGYQIIFDPSISVFHVIPQHRLTPQYFMERAYWQGISDLIIDKKHLDKAEILKKFCVLNKAIQYSKINPDNVFESVDILCSYSKTLGYLQSYVCNFSL